MQPRDPDRLFPLRFRSWPAILVIYFCGVWIFLTPPAGLAATSRADAAEPRAGALLFQQHCARCHGAEGEGRGFDFPALKGSQRLIGEDSRETIAWILTGNRARVGFVTDSSYEMPGFESLSDEDIAIVANYVRCRFADRCDAVEPSHVKAVRNSLAVTP